MKVEIETKFDVGDIVTIKSFPVETRFHIHQIEAQICFGGCTQIQYKGLAMYKTADGNWKVMDGKNVPEIYLGKKITG